MDKISVVYIYVNFGRNLQSFGSVSSDGMDFARIDLPDILYSMEYANFKRTSKGLDFPEMTMVPSVTKR